jgi:hypothetical protein
MTLEEMEKSGAGKFMRADEFENAGITLMDNTPQEIVDVVREMADMIEGRSHPKEQGFWDAFPKSELHGEIHILIGSKFLKGYYAEGQEDTGSDTSARRIAAGSV